MQRREFLKYLGAIPLVQFSGIDIGLEKMLPGDGLMSGIESLDKIKGGFYPGELTVIAGLPSMGKTALAVNITKNVILNNKSSACYFSIETSKDQLMHRILSVESGVSLGALRSGSIENESFHTIICSAQKLAGAKLYIDDQHGVTPAAIKSAITKIGKQELLIVDYLQLMNSDVSMASRHDEVESILISLKKVATDLKIPVVALAQLNRGVETRNNRRPKLSDLREIKRTELIDSAILLYRDGYYDRDSNSKDEIELNVIKNSFGATGVAKAKWQPSFGKIS
jgi:replicative DNA helicase